MALKGELTDIPVEEVIKIISETKGTGVLTLKNDLHSVELHFLNGKLINAKGDKSPADTVKLAFIMEDGEFEFNKSGNVAPAKDTKELQKVLDSINSIKEEWKKIKKSIPSENLIIKLSEAGAEQIELSGHEWKIIALLKEPTSIPDIEKKLNIGVFDTLKVLSSLVNKGLVAVAGKAKAVSEVDESIANIVPIRNLGYWAMRTPLEGIKNIEFYRRIDDKKTLGQIAKEMGISLKEAKEIFDYLLKNDKVEKPRRS